MFGLGSRARIRQPQDVLDPKIVVGVLAAMRNDDFSFWINHEIGGQSPNATMNPLSAPPLTGLAAQAGEGLAVQQRFQRAPDAKGPVVAPLGICDESRRVDRRAIPRCRSRVSGIR